MANNIQDSASLIAALNAANSSIGKKPAASSASSTSATQDKFLLMLTTQLKNQDPLNPLDNAQLTSQLAQLNTVSGINQLNTTLQALSNSMAVGQSVSATSMIGHGVLVPGSSLNLVNGQSIGGVELAQPVDNLTLTIKDSAGNIVDTMKMGAQQAGVLPFTWDGTTASGAIAPNGTYSFTASASLSGNKVDAATLAFGTVNAVNPGAKGAMVNVGQLGGFTLSDVKQVL